MLTGLTEISDVNGTEVVDGVKMPAEGQLFYQGYDVKDLIGGAHGRRYVFEEITYLLLFGALPTKAQLESFKTILTDLQELSNALLAVLLTK